MMVMLMVVTHHHADTSQGCNAVLLFVVLPYVVLPFVVLPFVVLPFVIVLLAVMLSWWIAGAAGAVYYLLPGMMNQKRACQVVSRL
jgi:hypothetical protein